MTAAAPAAALLPDALSRQRALRSALGRFATGVTVVATECAAGRVHRMTVNSFTSLSLDPALILWTLRTHSARFETFSQCALFSVSVLAEAQIGIARESALPCPGLPRHEWSAFRLECPVIDGAAAHFVCRRRNIVHEGDHAIVIGEVLAYADFEHKPLLFVSGGYYSGQALQQL